jgi:hypothetical protein
VKFPNLRECYPKIKEIIPEKIDTILSFKRFSVESYDMTDPWLSYWLDPKRTQEEFNSISQSFTLKYSIPPCNDYNIIQRLSCKNGYLKIGYCDTALCDLILPLIQKYHIILDVKYLGDWKFIYNKVPNKMRLNRLKVRNWDPFNNLFSFLVKLPHINYFEIKRFESKGFVPKLVIMAERYQTNLYQKEITMKFPVPIDEIAIINNYFPNAEVFSTLKQ